MVETLLLGLVVFRAWRAVGEDQITEPMRAWLLDTNTKTSNWIVMMLSCCWCLGFWLALAGSAMLASTWTEFVMMWFGSSAVAGLLASWEANLRGDIGTD